MRSGVEPGTIRRFDATRDPLPGSLDSVSTHSLPLSATIELARQLERMPARMIVYAVEGRQFDTGVSMSSECEAAADVVAQAVVAERRCPGSVLSRSD
jgi:hydrogenase maturation protease